MAKLILSFHGVMQHEYELDQERMVIGRKAENEIHIDNLAISGKHAAVTTILDDSFLEDLGSTNGTYVNGKLIKKHALRNGDIVAIGKHELKYVNEDSTISDEEIEKTMIIRPTSEAAAEVMKKAAETATVGSTNDDAGSVAGGATANPAKLVVLNGPLAGKELVLSKALVTLGKPGTQVAVISRRSKGYFLTHIESDGDGKRYPIVNGQPIGEQKHALKDGDTLKIAGITMEFMHQNSEDGQKTPGIH